MKSIIVDEKKIMQLVKNGAHQHVCSLCKEHHPELFRSTLSGRCLCKSCVDDLTEILKQETK